MVRFSMCYKIYLLTHKYAMVEMTRIGRAAVFPYNK